MNPKSRRYTPKEFALMKLFISSSIPCASHNFYYALDIFKALCLMEACSFLYILNLFLITQLVSSLSIYRQGSVTNGLMIQWNSFGQLPPPSNPTGRLGNLNSSPNAPLHHPLPHPQPLQPNVHYSCSSR